MIKVTGIPAGNHGPARPASQVTQATFHHIVGDAAGAIAEMRKASRQMSWSFCVGSDGKIYEGTGIGTVPYCDGNYASNKRSVSTEHAGGLPSVPYTAKMYASSIKLHAWLIDQLGIKSFKRHRDVSDTPTACPGGLDVEKIVAGAKKLRASYYGGTTVQPTKKQTFKTKRNYALNQDSYIQKIPSGVRGGDKLHKKGEVLDIGEYTEWPNGKKFYRTKKQVAEKDQRGYGKSKLERLETGNIKSVTFN